MDWAATQRAWTRAWEAQPRMCWGRWLSCHLLYALPAPRFWGLWWDPGALDLAAGGRLWSCVVHSSAPTHGRGPGRLPSSGGGSCVGRAPVGVRPCVSGWLSLPLLIFVTALCPQVQNMCLENLTWLILFIKFYGRFLFFLNHPWRFCSNIRSLASKHLMNLL